MFIISALYKRGPFHATKVDIIKIMCNTLTEKTKKRTATCLSVGVAVTGVTAWMDG